MSNAKITRYEVPIAIRALKTVNIYSVNSDKHFLIDTGMSADTVTFLEKHNFDFASLDMVIMTHLHIDHIGGANAIRSKYGIPLAIGTEDAKRVDFIREEPDSFRKKLLSFLVLNGTPASLVEHVAGHHSALDQIALYSEIEFDRTFDGGEEIASGTRILSNPGHSPGSKSIYLEKEGILFAGDHVLPGITPNISFYDDTSDMLGQYLESLKDTRKLGVKEVMPGHRNPFSNCNRRIDEILHHHGERLNEIISATKDWQTAYDIASKMKWNNNRTLDSMNLMEKNFAIGEAISHLQYLTNKEVAERKEFGGIVKFKVTGNLENSS